VNVKSGRSEKVIEQSAVKPYEGISIKEYECVTVEASKQLRNFDSFDVLRIA